MRQNCLRALFVGLCAEVEGDHHRNDDHHSVRGECSPEGENGKNGADHHCDNGLDFYKICEIV